MPLATGDKLGPFEITAKIGEARDPRTQNQEKSFNFTWVTKARKSRSRESSSAP